MDSFMVRSAIITLEASVIVVLGAMVVGLFDPIVDNKEIFKIISPAFQQVIAALIGVVGYEFGRNSKGK